jgi:integrase/recombinase XerD
MTALRQRFIQDLQLRNRSPRTVEVYVHRLRQFARFFNQAPDQLGADQVHRYLLHLLHEKKASWSAYNQAEREVWSPIQVPVRSRVRQ